MSWPHILSFSRVVAGPIVTALVLQRPGDAYFLAAVIFLLASVTDLVDGKLARYAQRESPLGVFLDTTADKVFLSLVLVGLAIAGLAAAWVPLLIISREFVISGLRSYAASCGRIISAHIWGKGKAALTMAAVFILLLAADGRAGGVLGSAGSRGAWNGTFTAASWLLGVSAALTVVSGARYIVDAWPLLRPQPEDSRVAERPKIAAGGDG
jgi:CDP-diacylglycerol--glycerol-3-phosphate 3-phosphatidyltransferase